MICFCDFKEKKIHHGKFHLFTDNIAFHLSYKYTYLAIYVCCLAKCNFVNQNVVQISQYILSLSLNGYFFLKGDRDFHFINGLHFLYSYVFLKLSFIFKFIFVFLWGKLFLLKQLNLCSPFPSKSYTIFFNPKIKKYHRFSPFSAAKVFLFPDDREVL